MKTLLTTLFIALLAMPALAVDEMAVSGAMDMYEDYILVGAGAPFDVYVILVDPSSTLIGGYECGISFQGGEPFVLAVTGPNGWTNFGGNLNHLVGYTTPLPAAPITVLCTINCLVPAAPFSALVQMGASDPSSFGGEGPGYADGADPDFLVMTPPPNNGTVAIITTEAVATEPQSFSGVKSLFE